MTWQDAVDMFQPPPPPPCSTPPLHLPSASCKPWGRELHRYEYQKWELLWLGQHQIFEGLLIEKSKSKCLLAYMTLLTNSEALQRPFDPVNANRKSPVILKIVREAGYDSYTGENSLIEDKQGQNRLIAEMP
jgi:hypothetical protein